MRLRNLTLLTFMTVFWLPLLANAATYNWYFSDDGMGNAVGNDSTGNGSVSRPWKTLSKAQNQINTLGSGDTANLFFDRGDTWAVDTGATVTTAVFGLNVGSDDPVVNIDAYGSGDRPIFDGLVADFSSASAHNATTGPLRWSRIFHFEKTNCSISNVEIKRVYGNAILLKGADGFTLSNCLVHHFGAAAVNQHFKYGIEDCIIEYNTLHTGQQLRLYNKRGGGWDGAIHFIGEGYGNNGLCRNNTIRYNLVYDISGEGINASSSTVEYNIIGDTYSLAIDVAPQDYDEYTSKVRYNFVVGSSSNTYGRGDGVRIFDERAGGDNSNGDISIYGNVFINRNHAIRVYCSTSGNNECGNTHGTARIYNNLAIDSGIRNYTIDDPEEVNAGFVYNNVSIHYDRTGKPHAGNSAHANWTFSHNAFYPVNGGNPVGSGWTTNYVTGDPKLPGEYLVDWDGLTGKNYFNLIDFDKDLYIPTDSSLANAGKILGSGYNSMFLTSGTDFSTLKFQRINQPNSGRWCIGAIIPEGIGGKITGPIPPPKDLNIIF